MANADSTASKRATESELEKQYPITAEPFAVWYCKGEGLKWAANNHKGHAIAMAANRRHAAKIAKAFRAVAFIKALKKTKALNPFSSIAA